MTTNNGGNGDNGTETPADSLNEAAEDKPKRQSAYRFKEELETEGAAKADDASNEPATEEEGPAGASIGDSLKKAFRKYVVEHVAQPTGTDQGQVKVNIDVDFIKNHGPGLISSLFESLTKTILPGKLELGLGKGEGEKAPEGDASGEAAEAAPSEGEGDAAPAPEGKDVDVAVNFDLGKFVKSLFTLKPAPEKKAEASEEWEEEYEYVEEEVEEEVEDEEDDEPKKP